MTIKNGNEVKPRFYISTCLLFVIVVVLAGRLRAGEQEDEFSQGEKLFALRVQPIFALKCAACHGDDPQELGGEFDMRNRVSVLRGGESFGEEVLISGKGKESFLYRVVAHLEDGYEMPPKLADRLTEEETWSIRDWITAGAPWPDDKRILKIQKKYAEGEQVQTSKALSDDWQNRRYESEKLWAYRPLSVENVPSGSHPIDWFLDRKLAAVGIQAAGDAPPIAMVRRMSFGLTGLPPTADEVARFTKAYNNDPADAVNDFADNLMASPHYGEQFGQHWLDVTRYADSAGFANDFARPNAWRYRDYVVESFNNDKRFDQFVREQIAGDEMDDQNPEYLIATGFLRMGPWEHTGMSVFKETRQYWLDDVTDSVGQTFLGHAMQCAKCHDHKFDPVPTRDYYSMMAVFSTTQFADRNAKFLRSESRENFKQADDWVSKKLGYYNDQLKVIGDRIKAQKKNEKGEIKVGDDGLAPGDLSSQARMKKAVQRHSLEKLRTKPIAHAVYTGKTVKRNNFNKRIMMFKQPWEQGVLDPDVIFTGGSVYSHGEAVVPGALSAAESLGQMEAAAFPTAAQAKRRLALANWIANPKNPLTARVIVNRVWAWHFGKGIAGNPNNFGGTGKPPTHPALLDYLASRFVEDGWSIKKLNRLIVSSKAYRRSSTHSVPQSVNDRDPKNQLYATFGARRLSAEEIRDAMLFVSGELNSDVGGVPARPNINLDVAFQPRALMGGTASVYEPDPTPQQRNRRTLYAEKLRGLRDPFLETFNQPVPDDSCELRENSTIAPQALTLFNAEEVHARALAFAARLLKESQDDEEVIQMAFRDAMGRSATKDEVQVCTAAWLARTKDEAKLHPKPTEFKAKISRTVKSEKTGQLYTFVEHLPAYENYVPDLQRCDVDARTRGLSHVCLVLFNSNEFAYLD